MGPPEHPCVLQARMGASACTYSGWAHSSGRGRLEEGAVLADTGRTHQGECGSGARIAALGAAGVVWVSVPDHVEQAQGD